VVRYKFSAWIASLGQGRYPLGSVVETDDVVVKYVVLMAGRRQHPTGKSYSLILNVRNKESVAVRTKRALPVGHY